MELTSHVKPAEKKEVVKTYSDREEEIFVEMMADGAFAEDIAAELDRPLQ